MTSHLSEACPPRRSRRPERSIPYLAAGSGLLVALLAAAPAEARTITADQFGERVSGTAGCTLREAIRAITSRSPVNGCPAGDGNNDTIALLSGTYTVRLAASTDTLNIQTGMTITGNGVDVTSITVASGALDGVNLFTVTSSSTVTFTGLKLTGVSKAHALFVRAGASARMGFAHITNSGNALNATGGCLQNAGALTLSQVEISGCSGWLSGGIYNTGGLFIQDSAIIGSNGARVGALLNDTASANANVFNTTIAKNEGGNQATAVANFRGAVLSIHSSTIVFNTTSETFAISAVRNDSPSKLTIKNTIISGNRNQSASVNANCTGTVTSNGYNYLGTSDFTRCQPVATQTTDVWGGSEGLLADASGFPVRLGGVTRVYVPRADSLVVSQIPESECLTTDQRGMGRRDGSNCEIGAANRAHATLIVGNSSAPASEDVQMASWLQGLGFDTFFHDDDAPPADTIDIGLTIGIISTTVSDAAVGTKYRDAPMGFVMNKVSALDNMSLVAANALGVFNTTQHVRVAQVPDLFQLRIGNAAASDINLGGGGWGTPAGTAAESLVFYSFNNKPAIFRVPPGAAVAGGFILPGGRISFPGWPTFFTGSGTPEGKAMFYETVLWASRNRR